MWYYRAKTLTPAEYDILLRIKENDGYLGQLDPDKRRLILPYATVELSPSGLDMQWTLTADAKKSMTKFRSEQRSKEKNKGRYTRTHLGVDYHRNDVVVPLTIEVLDALKSIRELGHPNTEKLEILSRIQVHGVHAAKMVQNGNNPPVLVHGSLAECRDGVWTLTRAGENVEAGHIRKSECAQFSGKVR